MADLLDIAPSTAVDAVTLNDGATVDVRGLNGNALASIMARFPDLLVLLGSADQHFAGRLVSQFGAAIAPIIAAGCGHLGDEKAEAIAGQLLPEDQLALVSAIYRLTFPNGIGLVMDKMVLLMNGAIAKEQRPIRSKPSPSPLPPSSGAASRPTMS